LVKVQRIIKAVQFRTDPKLAIHELCEALAELTTALREREQALKAPLAPSPAKSPPPG
jgi:hypothetical protein